LLAAPGFLFLAESGVHPGVVRDGGAPAAGAAASLGSVAWVALAASAALTALAVLLAVREVRGVRLRRILERRADRLGVGARALVEAMARVWASRRTMTALLLTTSAALAINLVRFYLLLLALGLALPLDAFVFGTSLANLVGLLPISIAGIGTRDTVLTLVFQSGGQSPGDALAYSALILAIAYGLNLLLGFPAWLACTSTAERGA
jgi:uncharacterized membrane protein YbhN (UPF0104 family)